MGSLKVLNQKSKMGGCGTGHYVAATTRSNSDKIFWFVTV
jgi:hypothetical protein